MYEKPIPSARVFCTPKLIYRTKWFDASIRLLKVCSFRKGDVLRIIGLFTGFYTNIPGGVRRISSTGYLLRVVQPTQVEDLFSRLKEAEESVAKAEGELEPWDFFASFLDQEMIGVL